MVAIGLPLLVMAARALVLRRTRTPEAWRGGWGAGVVLVALVAFEPSMIIFAMLVGILGAIVLRRSPRKIGRIGIALGVPLVVLLPWWPTLISAPGRLFVGPDSALAGVTPAAPAWQLLLGRDVGPGLPPLWVGAVIFGVIWLVALLGLARRPARRAVLAAWAAALVALGMAVVLSRLVVAVPPAGTEVRPWVGSYLLLGFRRIDHQCWHGTRRILDGHEGAELQLAAARLGSRWHCGLPGQRWRCSLVGAGWRTWPDRTFST